MSLEKHEFDFWFFPELFARVITFTVVAGILANYWINRTGGKIILPILLLAFLLWAFRPFFIAVKNFKLAPKKDNINCRSIMLVIFGITSLMGFMLLINRLLPFLPTSEWIILLDHLFTGFLVPLWFYILFLGIISFIYPKRKLIFETKWFILAFSVVVITLLIWEGFSNFFNQPSQIISELFGLTLSWIYFIKYKKILLNEN